MPFDYLASIEKPYSAVPVARDFIPSRYLNTTSDLSSNPTQTQTSQPPIPEPHSQLQSSATGSEVKPQILWVGCSDSFIVETECLDLLVDEIFVHRNLGNICSNGDLSSRSALEWAVGLLKVDHIIVCGHYDCALIDKGDGSALGGWHKNITKLHNLHDNHVAKEPEKGFLDEDERHRKLEEVYVLAEVGWLRKQEIVKTAIEERGLKVHGFVFDKDSGEVMRLIEQ